MKWIILIPFLLSSVSSANTGVNVNGPCFGIGTNLDEDFIYSKDNPLSKSGMLNISITKSRLYFSFYTTIEEYGSLYESLLEFYDDMETRYSGISTKSVIGFRFYEAGPIGFLAAVSGGYQKLDYNKYRYTCYYDDEGGAAYPATIGDIGKYSELLITGGPIIIFDIRGVFESDNYCGFGFGKLENNGSLKEFVLAPPYITTAIGYGYISSGLSIDFISNNRIITSGPVGIFAGFVFTKRPVSPGFTYLADSEIRYSEHSEITYTFYLGPSFSF